MWGQIGNLIKQQGADPMGSDMWRSSKLLGSIAPWAGSTANQAPGWQVGILAAKRSHLHPASFAQAEAGETRTNAKVENLMQVKDECKRQSKEKKKGTKYICHRR